VFPITYASALVTLGVGTYRFRKRAGLSILRSLLLGAGLATAGTGLFEIIWQGLGHIVYPNQISGGIWLANYVLNGSWIFLSFGSIQYWRITRQFLVAVSFFVLGWIVWLVLDFPQVFQSANNVAFILNSSLKILSFGIFLSLMVFETPNEVK
jgi:hypothetical protein